MKNGPKSNQSISEDERLARMNKMARDQLDRSKVVYDHGTGTMKAVATPAAESAELEEAFLEAWKRHINLNKG